MKCATLADAVKILEEMGIEFDTIYVNVFRKTGGVNPEDDHHYINNTEHCTVAYYNMTTHILTLIDEGNGRFDGTPDENRIYLWNNPKPSFRQTMAFNLPRKERYFEGSNNSVRCINAAGIPPDLADDQHNR